MRYVYKVTSDIPLSAFSGAGNTAQISPAGRRPVDQIGTVGHATSGPQSPHPCKLRLELMAITDDA